MITKITGRTAPGKQENSGMSRVWAVACNTIAQAVRMKLAVSIIILLVILLPLMSVIMVGDGSLGGKLQSFSSYSISLMSLLICILTIAISTYSLSNDLKRKHIYLVITKPIGRFQIVLGKFLGVLLLDVFLLVIFSAIIYGLTIAIPKISRADESQLQQAQREFFTARQSLVDIVDDKEISQRADEEYQKLKNSGQLPEDMSYAKIISELRGREKMRERVVTIGTRKIWEFENVKPLASGESLFIRYKYKVPVNTSNSQIYGVWVVGDYRQERLGPGNLTTPVYRMERADALDTTQEFEVPADAITEQGYLAVVFFNPPVNGVMVIPEDIEVLYRAGSFTANYAKVILMIFARLVFLTALGVSVSTWLSFPVALLVCMVFFATGLVNGFFMESVSYLDATIGLIYHFTVKPILWFFPRFDGEFNPTRFIVTGRIINWMFLARLYFVMVFIKSALLLFFGVWIFSNREIAKVTA